MIRLSDGQGYAVVREGSERISAILHGTDDVSVHTVAVIARAVGRNQSTIRIKLTIQQTARGGRRKRRSRKRQIATVAVVAHRAADAFLEDRRATVDVQDAFLHHTGRVIADAVAQVARIVRIRWHLHQVTGFLLKFALNQLPLV